MDAASHQVTNSASTAYPVQASTASQTVHSVETVHVIFKTHLDIGFTDFARNVVNQYHTRFIPQALATARALRERGGPERLVWTTGSWLIYEHLEQAGPDERLRMEQAIAAGDIAWHGLPFTTHTELMDPSLFAFGLSCSAELDRRFDKQTIAAKMTDVPGHTRGMIPLLAAAGIQFLHIGVNPSSRPPDVPPVFVWQDPSGASVVVMYHRGSYGKLMIVPGLADAIAFAHTGDNQGPPSLEQVLTNFQELRARLPGTQIVASTLDAFAHKLLTIKDQLPIVRAELGDTWIHGAGSDPLKISRFRELQRLRSRWLASGEVHSSDVHIKSFSRHLIMVPEHTWGLDVKTFLADEQNYDAASFRAARPTPHFRMMEESWREQRTYLDAALFALGDTAQGQEAQHALAALVPSAPDFSMFERVNDPAALFETVHFQLGFDPSRGSITQLVHKATGRHWSDGQHPLALVRYQTFGRTEYDRFWQQYNINKRTTAIWSIPDFTKPGIETALHSGAEYLPVLAGLYHRYDGTGHRFIADLCMPEESFTHFGAPRRIVLESYVPDDAAQIHLTLQWFEKPACRIAEAIWFSFVPTTRASAGWRLDKLGEAIEPHDVIRNGNRKLHAIGHGVTYHDPNGSFELETLDAPLVAPGEPSLLDFNNRQPVMTRGMHVNLLNNVWGTNFQMWFDDDMRFRFILSFS